MNQIDLQHNEELNLREKERNIAAANQNSAVARLVSIVYFIFGVIEVLLAVRLILRLLDANANNAFANFIYELSNPFVALFANLVHNPTVSTGAVLEITTIIAIVVYSILAWVIGRVVWLVLSRPR